MTKNDDTLTATEAISRKKFLPVRRELVERLSRQAESLTTKTLGKLSETEPAPEYAT